MSAGWQFVVNQTSVQFLLARRAAERDLLIKALEELAADPNQQGDYEARDSSGRVVQIKALRGFMITFWTDSFVNELRVIHIEKV